MLRMEDTMKYLKLIFMSLIFLPLCAFAQEVASEVVEVVSNEDFISALIEAIGGLKGKGTLSIVAVSVQLFMLFLDTKFGSGLLKGSVKLLVVSALSLVGGVVGLMVSDGIEFLPALMSSANLTALMVFGNQAYKQFFKKED